VENWGKTVPYDAPILIKVPSDVGGILPENEAGNKSRLFL
jgi:hypothetical protein